jgi:hypothetical protein
MNKFAPTSTATVFCGIDVSASSLSVALIEPDHSVCQREFANSTCGHKALLGWLGKSNALVRVSLEATGIYSLDLALALDAQDSVEPMHQVSGSSVHKPSRISHAGNRHLRRATIRICECFTRRCGNGTKPDCRL